jgi:hypothetical protein
VEQLDEETKETTVDAQETQPDT